MHELDAGGWLMRYGEKVTILRPDAHHALQEAGTSLALVAPVAEPPSPTVISTGQASGLTVYLPASSEPPRVGDSLEARGRRYTIRQEPQQWVGPDGARRGTVITLEEKP